MLNDLKEEIIVEKVGGRFRLSALIQKRLAMLNQGALPLVEADDKTPMEIVVEEILQEKVLLSEAGELELAGPMDDGSVDLDD